MSGAIDVGQGNVSNLVPAAMVQVVANSACMVPLDELPSTEAVFRQLALLQPSELIRRLKFGGLSAGMTARAAEALGRAKGIGVEPMLLLLLAHSSPIVQEGAVYGLAHRVTSAVRAALVQLVANERVVDGVREAAREVLADASE